MLPIKEILFLLFFLLSGCIGHPVISWTKNSHLKHYKEYVFISTDKIASQKSKCRIPKSERKPRMRLRYLYFLPAEIDFTNEYKSLVPYVDIVVKKTFGNNYFKSWQVDTVAEVKVIQVTNFDSLRILQFQNENKRVIFDVNDSTLLLNWGFKSYSRGNIYKFNKKKNCIIYSHYSIQDKF